MSEQSAFSLKERFSSAMLMQKGVEGVGVGLLNPNDARSGPAIIVYVRDNIARASLQGLPQFQAMNADATAQNIPVRIEVSGEFYANGIAAEEQDLSVPWAFEPMAGHPEYARRIRPVQPGYSVGRPKPNNETGTAGLIVLDDPGYSQLYIASNCHIINGNNDSAYYETIQPGGVEDGGISGRDTVGRADRYIQLKATDNYLDAATAIPTTNQLLDPSYPTVGAVPGHYQTYSVGWTMYKVGRTTGPVRGRVDSVNTDTSVNYGAYGGLGVITFKNQTVIIGDQPVSLPGDSGSIWLRDNDKYACSVNFAWSADGRMSISFPFNWFAQVFKVVVAVARPATPQLMEAGDVITSVRMNELLFCRVLSDVDLGSINVVGRKSDTD